MEPECSVNSALSDEENLWSNPPIQYTFSFLVASLFHFLIRETEEVAKFITAFDGKVASLIEEKLGTTIDYIRTFKHLA